MKENHAFIYMRFCIFEWEDIMYKGVLLVKNPQRATTP